MSLCEGGRIPWSYHMEGVAALPKHWRAELESETGFAHNEGFLRNEQSSPGNLQVGQVPSNWTRQIPQTSSSGISQRQVATAFHSFRVTFMAAECSQLVA